LSNPVNCYRIVAEKLQYTVKRKLDNNPKIAAASPSKKQFSQEKLAVLYVHVLVIYTHIAKAQNSWAYVKPLENMLPIYCMYHVTDSTRAAAELLPFIPPGTVFWTLSAIRTPPKMLSGAC